MSTKTSKQAVADRGAARTNDPIGSKTNRNTNRYDNSDKIKTNYRHRRLSKEDNDEENNKTSY